MLCSVPCGSVPALAGVRLIYMTVLCANLNLFSIHSKGVWKSLYMVSPVTAQMVQGLTRLWFCPCGCNSIAKQSMVVFQSLVYLITKCNILLKAGYDQHWTTQVHGQNWASSTLLAAVSQGRMRGKEMVWWKEQEGDGSTGRRREK
jgi:hypothetical protein